jgi:hypothetical protein
MLHEFVTANRDEIIGRCKVKVATRSAPTSTASSTRGIPVFLDQLVDELRVGLSKSPAIGESASQHGRDLLHQGFNMSQVVHDYGDVCQVITEMAIERKAVISPDDFRMLNRCLDDAIAGAVTAYARQSDSPLRGRTEDATESPTILVRQLKESIGSARVAFEMIKSGRVGLAGSTGTVLEQRLKGAYNLSERLLVDLMWLAEAPTRSHK